MFLYNTTIPVDRFQLNIFSSAIFLQLKGNLEYWKRRHFSTVSWSAVEMLYSERQMKWFKQDMDVPRWVIPVQPYQLTGI